MSSLLRERERERDGASECSLPPPLVSVSVHYAQWGESGGCNATIPLARQRSSSKEIGFFTAR